MAYKDILVFLDSTAEAVERTRFAVSLAKTHGARLIGVDVSAPPAGKEAESEAAVTGCSPRRRGKRRRPRSSCRRRSRARATSSAIAST